MTTIDRGQLLMDGIHRGLDLIDRLPQELRAVGYDWYPMVADRVRLWSIDTGYSQEQVSAVLANYNRNQTWLGSKTLTTRALYEGRVDGMVAVCRAVNGILALPRDAGYDTILPYLTNGSKTRHFYWACLNLGGCPCDRWIFGVWGCRQNEADYPLVNTGVHVIAQCLHTAPRHAEAVLWLAVVHAQGRGMKAYLP